MNDDHSLDLFWHALNYRTAATQHAQEAWTELEACVDRIKAAERDRCAKVCESQIDPEWPSDDISLQAVACAAAIRALPPTD